jgi:hypothetical protein
MDAREAKVVLNCSDVLQRLRRSSGRSAEAVEPVRNAVRHDQIIGNTGDLLGLTPLGFELREVASQRSAFRRFMDAHLERKPHGARPQRNGAALPVCDSMQKRLGLTDLLDLCHCRFDDTLTRAKAILVREHGGQDSSRQGAFVLSAASDVADPIPTAASSGSAALQLRNQRPNRRVP